MGIPLAQRVAIRWLSVAAFASSVSVRLCDPLLPELSRLFDASAADVARTVSAFSLAYGLTQLLVGPLGDRVGKYRLIAWLALLSTAGTLAAAFAPGLDMLVAARWVAGATAAGIIPLAMAWIGDTVPYENRQATLAGFLVGQVLGVVSGQLLGGLFADTLGWRGAFVSVAALYALTGLAVMHQARHNPSTRPIDPVRDTTGTAAPRALVKAWNAVLSAAWARLILGVVMLEGSLVFGALALAPSLVHHRFDLGLTASAGLVAGFGLGGLIYLSGARTFVRWLGEGGLATAGGLLGGAGWLLLLLAPAASWMLPASCMAGLGFYMLHNTLQTNATQMVPAWRGTAVALFASAYFLGQSLGVTIAAWLTQHLDRHSPFLVAAVGLPLLGAAMSARLRQRRRDAQAAEKSP